MADNVVQIIIRAKDEASKQLGNLTKELQSFARQVPGAETAIKALNAATGATGPTALLATAGVVALAAAYVIAAKAVLDMADAGARAAASLKEMSARTDISIEDLSRLKFAADQSDTSIEALATSMKFLATNIGNAKAGSEEAIAAFAQLGFTPDDIARFKDVDEALLAITERFKDLEGSVQRIDVARSIFGRAGDQIIPFLDLGPVKIRAYADESDRLGATLSTTAGIIGDDYTDALARMNAAMTGFKVAVSEVVSPPLTDFINAMTEVIALATNLSKTDFGAEAVAKLERAADKAIPHLGTLLFILGKIEEFSRKGVGIEREAPPPEPGPDFQDVESGKSSTIESRAQRATRLAKEAKEQREAEEKAAKAALSAAEAAAKAQKEQEESLARLIQKFKEAQSLPGLKIQETPGLTEGLSVEQIEELELRFTEAGLAAFTISDAMEQAGLDMTEFTAAAIEAGNAVQKAAEFALIFQSATFAAVDHFATGIGAIVGGFRTWGDALVRIGKLVEDIVRSLAAAVVKALILRALGFFAGGGTVVDTIGSAHRGGTTSGLAGGGMIAHGLGGLTIVPGAHQRRDQVPALLAPGEVVLPFINGQRPADVLGSIANLPSQLAEMVARLAAPQAPVFGTVVIQANDADSIQASVRRGEFRRQLERASELGR